MAVIILTEQFSIKIFFLQEVKMATAATIEKAIKYVSELGGGGLSIYKAAKAYGLETKDLAIEMSKRSKVKKEIKKHEIEKIKKLLPEPDAPTDWMSNWENDH